jgi:S1-C subfamily serine protease
VSLLALGLAVTGCASTDSRRGEGLRDIVTSSVQLRAERAGGGRRAGSGVVVASDGSRSWIITTRHLLEPPLAQQLYVSTTQGRTRVLARVSAVSDDSDLAVVEVEGLSLPPAVFQDTARLGDEVRVVGFPWGRRLTVVSGIVSQIASQEREVAVEGPVEMIDASVSYGASGSGVFDAATGALVGIVEG